MKRFDVRRTSRFKRHFYSLPERLGISKKQAMEAVNEIKEAIALLEAHSTLPPEYGYSLHELEREPWKGFLEFHALDDVLVIYADIREQNIIRLLGIYNHTLLANGKLD